MKNKFKRGWVALNSNSTFRTGVIFLCILILVALFAPLISGKNPYFLYDEILAKPSSQHFFGTDKLGRDVFAMTIHGARVSLMVGIVAASISAVLGTTIGAVAGYYGGKVERFVSEFINVFVMTPTFFLILLVIALFGSNIYKVMIVIGLTSWTGNARLMRGQAKSLKERTFVKSAKVIGESNFRIMMKHVIPNGIFPVIANTTMNISGAILLESSLSFLGLGDPNVVSWGQIIAHGKTYLTQGPWISIFPGLFIIFTVLTFFLIGDGLTKVLSPKLNQVEGGE